MRVEEKVLLAVEEGPVGGTSRDTCDPEDPATVRLETDFFVCDFFFLPPPAAVGHPET